MEEKINIKKFDIHCACARGVLLEFSDVKPVKKTEKKIEKKILTKDVLKKVKSNTKQ